MPRFRIVNSLRGIKPEERKIILEEAQRLKRNLKSLKGFEILRRAVQERCGITVKNIILRRVLKKHCDLMSREKKDEPCKDVRRPKHKRVHVRPTPGRTH